jgi:hypothetical protein
VASGRKALFVASEVSGEGSKADSDESKPSKKTRKKPRSAEATVAVDDVPTPKSVPMAIPVTSLAVTSKPSITSSVSTPVVPATSSLTVVNGPKSLPIRENLAVVSKLPPQTGSSAVAPQASVPVAEVVDRSVQTAKVEVPVLPSAIESAAARAKPQLPAGSDVYSSQAQSEGGGFLVGFYSGAASQKFTADLQYLGLLNAISRKSGMVLRPAYGSLGGLFERQIANQVFDVLHVGIQYFGLAKAAGYVPIARSSEKLDAVLVVKKNSGVTLPRQISDRRIAVADPSMVPLALSAIDKGGLPPRMSLMPTHDIGVMVTVLRGTDFDGVLVNSSLAQELVARSDGLAVAVSVGKPQFSYAWFVKGTEVGSDKVRRLLGGILAAGDVSTLSGKAAAAWYQEGVGVAPRFIATTAEDLSAETKMAQASSGG